MTTAQPAPSRDKTTGQISELPGVTTYLTGHNASGQAIVQERRPATWQSYDDNNIAFSVPFTTNFPADLNDSKDIKAHDETLKSGDLGLVKKNGVVCRQVRWMLFGLQTSTPC